MESISNGKGVSTNETRGEIAFNQLLPEFQALPAEDLVVIGVDVKSVVATVIGALPEIRAFSAQLSKVAPELNGAVLDTEVLDRLERSAFALNWAHGRYLSGGKPANDLLGMIDEGVELRDQLLSDANALARRKLIESSALAQVQVGTGYKNLAADLTVLSGVFKDNWPRIQGKCAVDFEEVERAGSLGERIIEAVGLREQAGPGMTSATDLRARVFTDVVQRYDNVRRIVSYVRWNQDDADKVAPSLYASRGRRRTGTDLAEPTDPAVPTAPGAVATATSKEAGNGASDRPKQSSGVPAETEPFVTDSE